MNPKVVTVSDPAAEAAAYAQRLGAEVARDRDAVERAVLERVEAARVAGADADGDAELLARADAIRAAARVVPVGEAELERLRALAAELARAERIRAHTERRLREKAAAGGGPAPAPPEPVVDEARRAAAVQLLEAERTLEAATLALTTAERAVTEAESAGAAGPDDGRDVAAVDAAVDRWEAALVAKESAEAAVDAARERWHALAGDGADPRDPTALLVHAPAADRPDPVAESPTLGAVAGVHRKVQARWRVQWAAVDGGEPPDPEHLEIAIAGLDGRRQRATEDLARLERAERRAATTAALTRPLVVVEPRRWAAADDLGQLLARLPEEAQVIVIERRSG